MTSGCNTPSREELLRELREIGEWELSGHYNGNCQDRFNNAIAQAIVALSESATLTIEDRRWRFLEHGCQWVGFNPINGNQYSFDPRIVSKAPGVGLLYMREVVDAAMEEHLKILREGINAVRR